jgi:hypothetical protein
VLVAVQERVLAFHASQIRESRLHRAVRLSQMTLTCGVVSTRCGESGCESLVGNQPSNAPY